MLLILDTKHELEGAYAVRSVVTWNALTTEQEAIDAVTSLETSDEIEDQHDAEIEEKDEEISKLEEENETLRDGDRIDEIVEAWRARCRSILAAARRYRKMAGEKAKPKARTARKTTSTRRKS